MDPERERSTSEWFRNLPLDSVDRRGSRYDDPDDRMHEIQGLLRPDSGPNDDTARNSLRFLYFRDLDERSRRIRVLLYKLERAIGVLASLAWEAEYERCDVVKDVQVLRQMLRNAADRIGFGRGGMSTSLQDVPPTMISILEAPADKVVHDLTAALMAEKSKNWELQYRCDDLDEDVWKLQRQLRNSVPMGNDAVRPTWRPKTAMEKELEERMVELEGKIRNPKGRGRSASM